MKQITFLISLLILMTPVTAEIYKGLDAEGRVIYTDKESPNAEKLPTPSPNTIQMPKALPVQQAKESDVQAAYSSFSITSPKNNATVRSDPGKVQLSLALEPALDTQNGHTISVLVDGRAIINKATTLNILLSNINRGRHSIKARVRDSKGKSLISSNSIRLHMKRHSSQHDTPTGTPPGPSRQDGSSFTPGPQGTPFTPGPITPPSQP